MRYERTEGRDREVENEPAVRGPVARETDEHELNREESPDPADDDATATRRGSSSERSDR